MPDTIENPQELFEAIHSNTTPPVFSYFNGTEWKQSSSGKKTTVNSPIDQSVVGEIQIVTQDEITQAFDAAISAQKLWETTALNQRVKIMKLAADWMRHYEEYLSNLLVREVGKTFEEAKSEIKRTADLTDYYANEVQGLRGEELDSDNFPGYDKGRLAMVERAPHGVVVAIAPFNYPVNLSASKIVPALLMGNGVVFKPPTQGAISGLHLTRIFEKAGVPAGLLSCVTGSGSEIGNFLVQHPKSAMIAFTGSSDVGVAIANLASMKPLLFECGGNNPVIILPDADMNLAAREIVKGGYSYAGQRCTGIKYVLGTKDVLEKLEAVVLKEMAEKVVMGDPRSPQTKMVGPVISEEAAKHIEELINSSVAAGATIVTGGKRNAAYIEPTLLKNVTASMPCVTHEVFGPVISFIEIKSFDEAVDIVNTSRFGLQASIFTADEGSGIVLAKRLNVGSIQINGSPQRGPDHFPFLGVKQSGLGVQGVRYSLEAMSRLRPIVLNKPG